MINKDKYPKERNFQHYSVVLGENTSLKGVSYEQ